MALWERYVKRRRAAAWGFRPARIRGTACARPSSATLVAATPQPELPPSETHDDLRLPAAAIRTAVADAAMPVPGRRRSVTPGWSTGTALIAASSSPRSPRIGTAAPPSVSRTPSRAATFSGRRPARSTRIALTAPARSISRVPSADGVLSDQRDRLFDLVAGDDPGIGLVLEASVLFAFEDRFELHMVVGDDARDVCELHAASGIEDHRGAGEPRIVVTVQEVCRPRKAAH